MVNNKLKSKVAVIGGSGFLGKYVCDELIKKHYSVKILDINPPNLKKNKFIFKKIDILNEDSLTKELKGCKIVFNFASVADIDECKLNPKKTFNTNLIGLINILNSCKYNRIQKFIYSSSVYVNGNKGSFYRISKKAAEDIISEYQLIMKSCKFITLRYGSLYGKDAQEWNSIYKYVIQAMKSKHIKFKGKKNDLREYIHIEDAARVTVDIALNKKLDGKYVITGNQQVRGYELIELFKEISNSRFKVSYRNMKKNDHYSITPFTIENQKAKKITLSESVDLAEGIKEIFDSNKL